MVQQAKPLPRMLQSPLRLSLSSHQTSHEHSSSGQWCPHGKARRVWLHASVWPSVCYHMLLRREASYRSISFKSISQKAAAAATGKDFQGESVWQSVYKFHPFSFSILFQMSLPLCSFPWRLKPTDVPNSDIRPLWVHASFIYQNALICSYAYVPSLWGSWWTGMYFSSARS